MKKIFHAVLLSVLTIAVLGVLGGIVDILSMSFAFSVGSNTGEVKESLGQSAMYLVTEVIHLFVIGNIFLWVRRQQPKYLSFAGYSLLANMAFDFISLAVPRAVQDARSEGLPDWLFRIGPVFEFVPPGVGSGLLALIFFYIEREYQRHPHASESHKNARLMA